MLLPNLAPASCPPGGPGTQGLSQPWGETAPPQCPAPCPTPSPGQTPPALRHPHRTRLPVRGSTPPSLTAESWRRALGTKALGVGQHRGGHLSWWQGPLSGRVWAAPLPWSAVSSWAHWGTLSRVLESGQAGAPLPCAVLPNGMRPAVLRGQGSGPHSEGRVTGWRHRDTWAQSRPHRRHPGRHVRLSNTTPGHGQSTLGTRLGKQVWHRLA